MPYQGKLVHLLGDLLKIPHVVDREERIIQQIIDDSVLESSPRHQQSSGVARSTRSLFSYLQVEKAFNTQKPTI
jgi:hypothetical protein